MRKGRVCQENHDGVSQDYDDQLHGYCSPRIVSPQKWNSNHWNDVKKHGSHDRCNRRLCPPIDFGRSWQDQSDSPNDQVAVEKPCRVDFPASKEIESRDLGILEAHAKQSRADERKTDDEVKDEDGEEIDDINHFLESPWIVILAISGGSLNKAASDGLYFAAS